MARAYQLGVRGVLPRQQLVPKDGMRGGMVVPNGQGLRAGRFGDRVWCKVVEVWHEEGGFCRH